METSLISFFQSDLDDEQNQVIGGVSEFDVF